MTTAQLSMLANAPAPEWLAPQLALLTELPPAAREDLWPAIEATLDESISKAQEASLGEFCKRHSLDPLLLGRALKAVRFLYRTAAQTDSPKQKLQADVRALLGEHAAVAEALLTRHFALATARIEAEISTNTLGMQGKVLTGFDWSIATVGASSFGRGLKLPVVTLTLRYVENGASKSITLAALPTLVRRLRDGISSFLE
ncbi:MAG: hypothetical protein U0271_40230 [Polyangiaceae bacterium]